MTDHHVSPSSADVIEGMREADSHLIWWTNQSDAERVKYLEISGLLWSWPDYVRAEFDSRLGRAGRGRLWFANDLRADVPPPPSEAIFEFGEPVSRMAEDAGGIVIRVADIAYVRGLPGFITTFAMRLFLALPDSKPDNQGGA